MVRFEEEEGIYGWSERRQEGELMDKRRGCGGSDEDGLKTVMLNFVQSSVMVTHRESKVATSRRKRKLKKKRKRARFGEFCQLLAPSAPAWLECEEL